MKNSLLCTAILILTFAFFVPAAEARVHNCGTCHGLHGASLVPAASQIELICLNCHGAAGTSTLKAEVHQNKPGRRDPPRFNFSFTCIDCHNPHEGESFTNWKGSANIKMVGRADLPSGSGVTEVDVPGIGLRNIVFANLTGTDSFADGNLETNGQYEGACETCHTSPELGHHPNELCTDPGCGDHSHHVGEQCTNCHDHDNYFWR